MKKVEEMKEVVVVVSTVEKVAEEAWEILNQFETYLNKSDREEVN